MALVRTSGNASNHEIGEMLGINLRTVQILRKSLKEENNPRAIIQRAPKALEDKRKSRYLPFIAKLEQMIKDDPCMLIRPISKDMKVEKKTVRRCVEEDLSFKSYILETGQLLTWYPWTVPELFLL
ncbi:unnamed protein product [Lepeophtheirus salmonis]|uniref:(salmon louse) hypothetical protein n=1 Tax=Lepeophtheirus salmonis TaxID=72036 RepID=A0A7R8CIX1_LEPSM|nr:unnamed protein product [Lepeophtheirus salmonis]CAF2835549.1 unnamed protein product [Lepeophtheirus salmonis]